MDTSEQYIKMSDCPEVQKAHWDSIKTAGIKRKRAYNTFDAMQRLNWVLDFPERITPRVTIFDADGNVARSIALLTRDQIQAEMYEIGQLGAQGGRINICPVGSAHCVVQKLAEFVETKYYRDCLIGLKSMEQLWLAFYMHEKHKKIWNGKKWVTQEL